jgi:hypothetical protein
MADDRRQESLRSGTFMRHHHQRQNSYETNSNLMLIGSGKDSPARQEKIKLLRVSRAPFIVETKENILF